VLLAVACLVLGGLTIARNRVWSDTLALWQDTVAKAPNKDLALANLAGEYMALDMPDKALPLFVRALELNPDFQVRTKVFLGMTLQRLNVEGSRFTSGEELIRPGGPLGKGAVDSKDLVRLERVLRNNLGLAYELLGEAGKAGGAYRAALRADPAYDLAWYNLGMLSIRTGNKGQALTALQQLRRLNPSLAESLATGMPQ
jgi:tetratricopeptide (TPR) repeat protein